MSVEVELFGHLARPGEDRRRTLDLEHPRSALEIAGLLGLDPQEIGLIVIDGVQSDASDMVSLDSRLCFFPPLSGG